MMRPAYARTVREPWKTALIALGGAIVGLLALVPIAHVDPWSWVVGPVLLAAVAVAQARALFSDGGPFRT